MNLNKNIPSYKINGIWEIMEFCIYIRKCISNLTITMSTNLKNKYLQKQVSDADGSYLEVIDLTVEDQ